MTESDLPKGVVTDSETAQVGAEAERPFRDAMVKYRAELTDDGRRALDLIASKEGEEAMAAFQQTRSLEDTRIDALRALASETIGLSSESRRKFGLTEEAKAESAVVEGLLKRLGQGVVDRIIADGTDYQAKAKRIRNLGSSMDYGVALALTSDDLPEEITSKFSNKLGTGGWSDETVAYLMRGYFLATIMTGEASRSIDALVEIGRLEGRDPKGVIQEHIPLLLELREQHPKVNSWTGMTIGARRMMRALDFGMERHNFLWSPGMKSYVQMSTQKNPATATELASPA